ncbi:TetR/AcrR family transcriptional regulator [Caldithrix abyssi]
MNNLSNRKSEDTRNRIFQAAAELFANYGFERVSIRQICEAVGVQKPTLYYYFKDKETLILEMIRFTQQIVQTVRKDYVDCKKDFLEKIRGLLYGRKYFVETYPHFFRFYAMLHLFSTTERVRMEMLTLMLPLLDEFTSILKQGQEQGYIAPDEDLEMLMQTILGTLNGLSMRKFVFQEEDAFSDENLQRVFDFWQKHLFLNPKKRG